MPNPTNGAKRARPAGTRERYLRTAALSLIACLALSLMSACTLLPQAPTDPVGPQTEAKRIRVTAPRVGGYVFIGLPRDLLDLPVTVFNRLFCYWTPKKMGLFGFAVDDLGDYSPAGISGGTAVFGVYLLNVNSGNWVWGPVEMYATMGGAILYPLAVAPLEHLLLRWPHGENLFGVGFRERRSECYDYFPNFHTFLMKEANKGGKDG